MNGDEDNALLDVLYELQREHSEMRFGQMICTLAILARDDEPESVWEMEDAELLVAARRMLAERRSSGTVFAGRVE